MSKLVINRHDKPLLIMVIGIAGCGKSTIAQEIVIKNPGAYGHEPVIHSSDALREEMFGDESVQKDHEKVFAELHKRIYADLVAGKDVVYDATNINKKQRTAFINTLKRYDCEKVAICVLTPFDKCLYHNQNRDRVVPYGAMKSMYMRWTPPHEHEGFDTIKLYFNNADDWAKTHRDIKSLIDHLSSIDQENKHHNLSIGEHCFYAANYIKKQWPDNKILYMAAMLHDIGKEFTKTKYNAKGEIDGQCHFYQHQNVGAYDAMFYLKESGQFTDAEMLYISNLIYYHMHPMVSWNQSKKSLNKAINLIGQEMYDDIMKVHEADRAAHLPDFEHETHYDDLEVV